MVKGLHFLGDISRFYFSLIKQGHLRYFLKRIFFERFR
jgi:hypothetical protein